MATQTYEITAVTSEKFYAQTQEGLLRVVTDLQTRGFVLVSRARGAVSEDVAILAPHVVSLEIVDG